MSVKRIVETSFWVDEKVVEEFSPEDKYFMLYLLTNPHSKQLGIYQLIPSIASFEMGYSIESIKVLLERFENKYEMLKYCKSTKEVAIKNYLVYSIVKGGKPVEDLLQKEIREVKAKSLLTYVFKNLYNKDNLNVTVSNIINEYMKNDNVNDNDNDNDVSYHDSYHDSLVSAIHGVDYKYSNEVEESILKWGMYKREKRQKYTATGLNTLLKQLAREVQEHGDKYVIDEIEYSMAQNYSGIYPRKDSKPAPQENKRRYYADVDGSIYDEN